MSDLREGYYWVKERLGYDKEVMRCEDGVFMDTYRQAHNASDLYEIGDRIDEPS
jgi:hypothetical protein